MLGLQGQAAPAPPRAPVAVGRPSQDSNSRQVRRHGSHTRTLLSCWPVQAPADIALTPADLEGLFPSTYGGIPPPPLPQPGLQQQQLVHPSGVKVCENCGTTTTPLWRKDRPTGMMMCNACGIFFKHHQKHRPVELAQVPPRTHPAQHPPPAAAGKAAAGSSPPTAAAEDSEQEDGSWERQRARRRTLPTAGEPSSPPALHPVFRGAGSPALRQPQIAHTAPA